MACRNLLSERLTATQLKAIETFFDEHQGRSTLNARQALAGRLRLPYKDVDDRLRWLQKQIKKHARAAPPEPVVTARQRTPDLSFSRGTTPDESFTSFYSLDLPTEPNLDASLDGFIFLQPLCIDIGSLHRNNQANGTVQLHICTLTHSLIYLFAEQQHRYRVDLSIHDIATAAVDSFAEWIADYLQISIRFDSAPRLDFHYRRSTEDWRLTSDFTGYQCVSYSYGGVDVHRASLALEHKIIVANDAPLQDALLYLSRHGKLLWSKPPSAAAATKTEDPRLTPLDFLIDYEAVVV